VLASPVDVAGVTVDLRGEDGAEPVEASVSASAGGVALAVQPAAPLVPGAEYNVALRIPGADPRAVEVLERAATFFVREDASVPLAAQARFVDAEGDGTWGNGSDQLRVSLSRALGRRGRVPAFRAETWLGLDLDGSGRVGDGAGELPPPGEGYPPPLVLEAREPSPGNGAALSGFTRRVAPLGLGLVTPLAAGAGPVTFELRLPAARNDGEVVGSPAGRAAPERLTGTMALVGP
jgi:hypothetical protein